jgi:tyrosyl-tRNA synthetase
MGQHHRGIDLCRKKTEPVAYGLTCLDHHADGSKFAKRVAGAVWIDSRAPASTSFTSFGSTRMIRDVIRYLKYFTFLGLEEIAALRRSNSRIPVRREAHRALAKAATDLIHGPTQRGGHPGQRQPVWRELGRHRGKHVQ